MIGSNTQHANYSGIKKTVIRLLLPLLQCKAEIWVTKGLLDKAKRNILDFVGKTLHTVSLEGSLSGDCDVKKNDRRTGFVDSDYAMGRSITRSSSVVSYGSDPPLSAFVYSSSSLIPTSSMEEENGGQEVHKAENHHHSSVAGGGVIIGGLATAFFATLYCYIKVTRKKDGDEKH
ncbi:hypothetical protein Tco_0951997 [Tanacetum coccineum]|uniref:Uncharacterized protein n=1 Tax=Tanacetum coccineum TaxID=301880 RepID=A0ABQ5DWJ5_9ASTR